MPSEYACDARGADCSQFCADWAADFIGADGMRWSAARLGFGGVPPPSPSEIKTNDALGSFPKMPRSDYKTCRVCGRHESEVGPLSHTRLCSEHSAQRFTENIDAMKT